MDRFISDIMRIYAANSQKDRRITAAQGNTRIVSIISPSGGTGKSSITAGCSVLCAGRGIRTFYLNLENIPSTNLFFHGDSTQSFSNAIFHLKGRGANLSLKLEGVKSIDTGSNVHYFKPPENIQDLNELTESDLVCLMNELKNSGVYDLIFIDTSAGLSPINTAIIKNSDIILLVMNPNRGSELKLRGLRAGLDLLERKQGIKLTCKIIPVINRVEEKAGKLFLEECDGFLGRCEQPAEIGDYSCRGFSDISSGLLENREFLSELGIVAERLLGLSIAELNFCDGGEHIA
jgi:cellulose biosynthesis protein BcsQ